MSDPFNAGSFVYKEPLQIAGQTQAGSGYNNTAASFILAPFATSNSKYGGIIWNPIGDGVTPSTAIGMGMYGITTGGFRYIGFAYNGSEHGYYRNDGEWSLGPTGATSFRGFADGTFNLGYSSMAASGTSTIYGYNNTNDNGAVSIRNLSTDVTSPGLAAPIVSMVKNGNSNSTSNRLVVFAINNNATGSGQINANGAGACAFGSFSDRRLKKNIVPLNGMLAKVLALKPCEFDYIDGSGHQTGFVAQEMREVFPDAVGEGGTEEKILTVTGWTKTEARLVAAIQELAKELIVVKAELAALKAV